MLKSITSILILLMAASSLSNRACPKPKPGMINVHLVCHTHDDVGWLKTVDQYYYGSRKNITWVGVQYILDSVIPSLLVDPSRKFIYVESAFFSRWWNEQNENMKTTVKNLVRDGQLEFIGGGWCMNDEAAAHYNAIIDQMTYGLRFLNKTFGEEAFPRVAWQIDPFGHSREQASLFAQMGFDGLFFGRLDYDDKETRWKNREMEMVWKGSQSLPGDSSWIFTGVLPRGYSPPKGFCFDLLCADDPMMDDPDLEDYNKDLMVDKFIHAATEQQKGYATSNIIMTMGEDFNYVYAESWYKNLDKLIKYVNARQENGSKVNVMYSTPSCYLDALHAINVTWPTKTDDFFPYASDPHAFWTGYFTSRPTLKGFIRQTNNLLQAVKQVSALSGLGRTTSLEKLAKAMAVAQHHDAVTGTAKQHVTDDYGKRLAEGISDVNELYNKETEALLNSQKLNNESSPFLYCPLLNISACSVTENATSFMVAVYNPLGRAITQYVVVPVGEQHNYTVATKEGKIVECQLVPLPAAIAQIPGRNSRAKYSLVFVASIPPLGTETFVIKINKMDSVYNSPDVRRTERSIKDAIIKKGRLSIRLDAKTKMLKSVLVKTKNGTQEIKVTQDWLWYSGMAGNNSKAEFRATGAYIFRPNGTANHISPRVKNTAIHDGPLVAEVHQEWSSWMTQVLRLYRDKNYLEMEWLVGPIPIEDGIGKEIVSRITWTDFKTGRIFYTDANGRELIKRVKDKRGTWVLNKTEPVSQNYYPVTSRIIVSSTNNQGRSALLNDRAQGGTSMGDGEMELMVHRRLLFDDAFGVGEPLNETAFGVGLVARGKHYLIHSAFGSSDCDFSCQHRTLAQDILLQPILTFAPLSSGVRSEEYYVKSKVQKSGLANPLPLNIHLLTLEPWNDGQWLLRLENFYEKGEFLSTNETVELDLKNLFTDWVITEAVEVTLAANMLKKDVNRLRWRTEADVEDAHPRKGGEGPEKTIGPGGTTTFTFGPMEIRSFVVCVKRK